MCIRDRDEIRKLGSVNVNAIEDYKELLERHTFLSGQYEDLVQAEKTLESIIDVYKRQVLNGQDILRDCKH